MSSNALPKSAATPASGTVTPTPPETPGDENAAARRSGQGLSEEVQEDVYNTAWRRSAASPPCFAYPCERPLVWVKWGREEMQAQADMQTLAWRWVRSEREAERCSPGIHVPEVYKVFARHGNTFIVMQLLQATTLNRVAFAYLHERPYPLEQCLDLIAEGIQVLRRMPAPRDATPGPYTADVGRRIIRHPLFSLDQKARIVYRNVDELEEHLNRVWPTGWLTLPISSYSSADGAQQVIHSLSLSAWPWQSSAPKGPPRKRTCFLLLGPQRRELFVHHRRHWPSLPLHD